MVAHGVHAHPTLKLGCLAKDEPNYRRALPFADHLIAVPSHPIAVTDTSRLTFGMDGNHLAGVCVAAGWDHLHQLVTALLTGNGFRFGMDDIEAYYQTQNPGFRFDGDPNVNGPGSPHDGGMVIQTFLEWLQKHGHILGFAKVDHTMPDQVRAASYLGLGLLGGYTLQVAQQTQSVFSYVKGSAEWGGHAMVEAADYDATTTSDITWGAVQKTDASFLARSCDELWFIILEEHAQHPGFRAGFDLVSFAAAFTALTGRPFPVVPAPPAPVESLAVLGARIRAAMEKALRDVNKLLKERGL